VLKNIYAQFQKAPIPFLITLHIHKLLFTILKFFYHVYKYTNQLDNFEDAKTILDSILAIAWRSFIKYEH